MADATRFAQAMKDMEERLSTRMDSRFIELATCLKETIQDLVKQSIDAKRFNMSPESGRHSSSYVCGTRLARIDFPIFNGDNVIPWIHQCDNYFLIDNTLDEIKVKLTIVHLEGKTLQWHTTLTKTFPILLYCRGLILLND